MKKNLLWMLASILTCCASMLTACSSNDNPVVEEPVIDNLAVKILGKWMMAETDGKPVPTDSKQVITYESGSKLYYSLSINAISDLNVWVNHCEGRYMIYGNNLSQVVELADANIKFTQSPNIISITDNDMYLITNNETFVDGKSHRITKDLNERKVRVTHDYSADIIGIWEGRQTSEEDVHSDGQLHRWEYKADGTFVYYRQDDNGEWVDDVNSMAEYFVDGVLLCTRWKNVGDDTEYRESWEIASIENDRMNWTAIRQKADGSTYTADFSMTRVKTEEEKTLTGEWFAVVNRKDYDEDADENDIEYLLLSFDENGVVTQNVYIGNKTEPLKYWERMHRHGIYTVDEKASTLTIENISETPTTSKYGFDKELLILNLYDEENVDRNMSKPLHRPSKAEKDLLAVYDISLWGDDYVGKWFGFTEHNGLYTYMMLDFTEKSGLKTIRYSVYNDKVTRTEYTQVYNEADDDEYEDEPVLEIHSSTDYMQSEFYWWKVVGNTLTLEKELEDEEFISSTYHALTKADLEMMEELDKKSNN